LTPAPPPGRLKRALIDVFGMDLRSLALMRALLGLLMVIDLGVRLTTVRVFASDWGAMPREAVMKHVPRVWSVSLYMGVGEWQLSAALMLIAAAASAMYALGWHTRRSGPIAWLLLIMLHTRAGLVLSAGDIVLRVVMFWALFLPTWARFSVDALRAGPGAPPPARSVFGVASAAFGLQLAFIYLFTAVLKSGRAWADGSAVYYALSIDYFAKQPFCELMLSGPTAGAVIGDAAVSALHRIGIPLDPKVPLTSAVFTYSTLVWEYVGPLLLYVPLRFATVRTAVVAAFMLLHVGFHLGLDIGIFPFVCMAAWVGLLPGGLWDRLGWADAPAGDRRPRPLAWTHHWAVNGAAFGLLLLVFNWNLSTLQKHFPKAPSVPHEVRWIGNVLRLDQKWDMFAPFPLKDDGWWRMPGTTMGGRHVDVWSGGEPEWVPVDTSDGHTPALHPADPGLELSRAKPADVRATFPDQRWRKYMRNLWQKENKSMRLYLGKHLCRAWNETHSGKDRLRELRMVYMKELTPKPGEAQGPVTPTVVWTHDCTAVPKPDETQGA
jgi:hypothetical protein